jgi:CheY-like chemotaxis protein
MMRRVVAVVDDLFFAARIRATGEQVGVTVEVARDADALVAKARQDPPALVILDLQAQRLDPLALVARLKADAQLRAVPLVGFLSHVEVELQQRARATGIDRVLPRSAFTKQLPELLLGRSQSEDA